MMVFIIFLCNFIATCLSAKTTRTFSVADDESPSMSTCLTPAISCNPINKLLSDPSSETLRSNPNVVSFSGLGGVSAVPEVYRSVLSGCIPVTRHPGILVAGDCRQH